MRLNDIRKIYQCWLSALIFGARRRHGYSKLLGILHGTPFRSVLERDQNRAMDGRALRYRFGCENDIPGDFIADAMDDIPCSVLEMMAALCLRASEQIIYDGDIQSGTERLFRDMLSSLGLAEQTDDRFSAGRSAEVLERFQERGYSPDGRGGLFTVSRPGVDMCDIEIWYQMCFYLDELIF